MYRFFSKEDEIFAFLETPPLSYKIERQEDFSFEIMAGLLHEASEILDLFPLFSRNLSPSDIIRVTYYSSENEVRAVVVEDNAQYGHIFDPTDDPALIEDLRRVCEAYG